MSGWTDSESRQPADLIGFRLRGIDHNGRTVTGLVVGVDPRPARLAGGPFFVVKPDNPRHDPVSINALAFVRCDSGPAILEATAC